MKIRRPLLVGMVTMVTLPIWQLTLALELSIVIVCLGSFVVGIAIELLYVLWTTAIQTNIPRESLSRVSSYDSFGSLMFGPIGIALAGPLVGFLGLTTVFLIAAAISMVAIVGALMSRAVRSLEATPMQTSIE